MAVIGVAAVNCLISLVVLSNSFQLLFFSAGQVVGGRGGCLVDLTGSTVAAAAVAAAAAEAACEGEGGWVGPGAGCAGTGG